jgi:oxygen-independent coproporphyrinogen-3 oxidase
MYLEHLPFKPTLKEVHLGGGTPTFFSPEQIERLMKGIFDKANIAEDHAFSFEAHPWSTTREHLQTFRDLGFNRISIGVQDFEPEILKIINRHQTTEQVENVVNWSRELGYDSINFDLIFGLPLQEPHHIEETMRQVKIMKPDRIAFYSYAHVPWVSPSQRGYSEEHLPLGDKKQFLYELGKQLLQEDGYFEIGLDHFAKETDDLYIALKSGTLHRNFMGYTSFHTDLMIGLGASSISDSGTAFVQNEKKIEAYQKRISLGEIPIIKGHLHSEEDVVIRKHITALMCQHTTSWNNDEAKYFDQIMLRLQDMEADGIVKILQNQITVTDAGMPFIRNVCMAFDQRLWAKKPTTQLFSQVV